MSLRTEELNLVDEIERLESDIDDLASQYSDLDPSTNRAQSLEERANRLDTHRRGVVWARNEWDVETITLKGLSAGEYGRLEDDLPGDAGDGATRIFYVAYGTEDAPYAGDNREETVGNVADLPIAYVKWAESQINDLTHVGGEMGNRFYSSLQETIDAETSGDASGENT